MQLTSTNLDPAQVIPLKASVLRVTDTLRDAVSYAHAFLLDGQGRHASANAYHVSANSAITAAAPQASGPDFTVQDGAGRSLKLSDFRGKVVLLDFWAISCGSCRPALKVAVQQARCYPQDVVVLAVDEWDTPETFRAWLCSHPFPPNLIMAIDTTHEAGQQYHVLPLPDEYLLDWQGRVQAYWLSGISCRALETEMKKLVMLRKKSLRIGTMSQRQAQTKAVRSKVVRTNAIQPDAK